MAPWVIEAAISILIHRFQEKHMNKVLKTAKWTAVLSLVVGSLAGVIGVDLAPEQVDALVNGAAVVVYIVTEVLEHRAAAKAQ